MNEQEFKRHLKDLVHGHHHPEEHDWESLGSAKKTAARRAGHPKRAAAKKASKRR